MPWPDRSNAAFAALVGAVVPFWALDAAAAIDLADFKRPEVKVQVGQIARGAILAKLANRPLPQRALLTPLDGMAGAFVTLSRRGQTIGCWGTVAARSANLADEIAANAVKALTFDTRFRAVTRADLADVVAHISIIGDLDPVSSPHGLQPRRFGLLVAGPGKGGVLLPGEAATAAWQVATCRRKAGLGARERARMYQFQTAVIGPIALAE